MLIRFQVGGDASPYAIAEFLKAICDEAIEAAGRTGDSGRDDRFAPEAGGGSSPRRAASAAGDGAGEKDRVRRRKR
jgi:hypothetical protein